MISPLLILAETATHGEGAGGITRIVKDFGIDLPFLLAQIINFSVVALILYKLAWKPVLATLDVRQKKIESGLKYAEEMQAKLAATQQETAGIIKNSRLDAQKIVEEARKSAKDFLDRQTQEATEKAGSLFTKAQQAIELEHKKMLADARVEIARLVVTTTQRVLAKELSDAERARYNDAATRELTSV